MRTFKQFLAEVKLIDMRKKRLVWKTTVAAGKEPTTNFDIVGLRIGQEQSTGDTSRVSEDTEDFVQRWIAKHKNLVAQIKSDFFTKSLRDDEDFKARVDALPPGVEDAIWSDIAGDINRDTDEIVRTRKQEEARAHAARKAAKPRPTLHRVK